MEAATPGAWIALASLLIAAATLIAGAISMNNKARTSYVDFVKQEMEALRGRLEDMGREHEGLKRDYQVLKGDLARCVEDCRRRDDRIAELMRENNDLVLRLALGPRMSELGRAPPAKPEGSGQ